MFDVERMSKHFYYTLKGSGGQKEIQNIIIIVYNIKLIRSPLSQNIKGISFE